VTGGLKLSNRGEERRGEERGIIIQILGAWAIV